MSAITKHHNVHKHSITCWRPGCRQEIKPGDDVYWYQGYEYHSPECASMVKTEDDVFADVLIGLGFTPKTGQKSPGNPGNP